MRGLCAGLLSLLLLASSLAPARAQTANPAARFGVIGGYEAPREAEALGAAWDVIPFSWAALQPDGPDDFNPRAVSPRWLSQAMSAGREVVGLIVDTPAWASESGERYAVPAGLDLPVHDARNVWAGFVTRLVRHYGPLGVRHWIVYDQPNVRLGEGTVAFAGSETEYARLLQVAYEAAHAAHPQAAIHTAALHPWVDAAAGREPYLARLLDSLDDTEGAADAGFFFDVLTLRALNDTAALWTQIDNTRALLDRYRIEGKPIWLEIGASPTREGAVGGPDSVLQISPDQQADYVVQAAAAGLAAGAERIGVYRLQDEPGGLVPWGLVRADGTRRAAFEAYQGVIELFGPSLSAGHRRSTHADFVLLEQAAQDVYVLWASGPEPVQFVVTAPQVGEIATLTTRGRSGPVEAEPFNWPAAFLVDAPGARPDDAGRLTVAGQPRILVLPKTDFYRVVYAVVDGQYARLR